MKNRTLSSDDMTRIFGLMTLSVIVFVISLLASSLEFFSVSAIILLILLHRIEKTIRKAEQRFR